MNLTLPSSRRASGLLPLAALSGQGLLLRNSQAPRGKLVDCGSKVAWPGCSEKDPQVPGPVLEPGQDKSNLELQFRLTVYEIPSLPDRRRRRGKMLHPVCSKRHSSSSVIVPGVEQKSHLIPKMQTSLDIGGFCIVPDSRDLRPGRNLSFYLMPLALDLRERCAQKRGIKS